MVPLSDRWLSVRLSVCQPVPRSSTHFCWQQLSHQMGRDGVPLDEVSNLMSRMSCLKRQRQHSRKKPSQTHVLVSDVNAWTQGQSWETREISHLPKGDSGRTQLHPFARHTLVNSLVHRSCAPEPRWMRPHWEIAAERNHAIWHHTRKVGEVRHALGLTKHNNVDIQFGPRFIPTSCMSH